jgi:hypothetical protein
MSFARRDGLETRPTELLTHHAKPPRTDRGQFGLALRIEPRARDLAVVMLDPLTADKLPCPVALAGNQHGIAS